MIKYFETIRCENKKALHLKYHQQRVFNTIGKWLEFHLEPPTNDLYRCKIIYTKNHICAIQYYTYTPKKIHKFKLIYDNNLQYNYKYLDRSLIDQYQDKSYDEIIIVQNNYITDTSIANIAIFLDNIWLTPKTPLLYGTTRERYLDDNKIYQRDITVEMLRKATKIMTLNAMVKIVFQKNEYIIIE